MTSPLSLPAGAEQRTAAAYAYWLGRPLPDGREAWSALVETKPAVIRWFLATRLRFEDTDVEHIVDVKQIADLTARDLDAAARERAAIWRASDKRGWEPRPS